MTPISSPTLADVSDGMHPLPGETFRGYVTRIIARNGGSRPDRRKTARQMLAACKSASIPVEGPAEVAIVAIGRAGAALEAKGVTL